MPNSDEEFITTVRGWVVIYPAKCNGHLGDLGFVVPASKYGLSDFVHFDSNGEPYGTYMPKAVSARIRAMRNRALKNKETRA